MSHRLAARTLEWEVCGLALGASDVQPAAERSGRRRRRAAPRRDCQRMTLEGESVGLWALVWQKWRVDLEAFGLAAGVASGFLQW